MKNKGKIRRQERRTWTRLILATLLALLIAVCLFSQSRQSTRAGEIDKLDRLEPSLAWVDRYSTLPAGETVPVIVQFAQDESAGEECHTQQHGHGGAEESQLLAEQLFDGQAEHGVSLQGS